MRRFRIKNEGDSQRKIKKVAATATVNNEPVPHDIDPADIWPGTAEFVEDWPPAGMTTAITVTLDTEDMGGQTGRENDAITIEHFSAPDGLNSVDATLRFPNEVGKHYITLVIWFDGQNRIERLDLPV